MIRPTDTPMAQISLLTHSLTGWPRTGEDRCGRVFHVDRP